MRDTSRRFAASRTTWRVGCGQDRISGFSLLQSTAPEKLERQAEAEVVVAVRRRIPVAISHAAVPGVVVPAAAPVHAIGAGRFGDSPFINILCRKGRLSAFPTYE